MERIEINVRTGEQTIIPLTPEEIAALPPPPPPITPRISFAQLLIGLVRRAFITEPEAFEWASGTLPAIIIAMIASLPNEMRLPATLRALRPTDIDPDDLLVNMMVAQQNLSPQQKHEFFVECSNL